MTIDFETLRQHITETVPRLKHCELLNIDVLSAEPARLELLLPYHEKLIGNPETRVIHGGAITTLMDTSCGFAAVLALTEPGICPTLDLRIDYMRPAEPGKDIIGKAEAYHVSRSVVFTRGLAFHRGYEEEPIAHCTASFMRLDAESLSKGSTNS